MEREKEKAEIDETKRKLVEFYSGCFYSFFITCVIMGLVGFPSEKNKEKAELARFACQVSSYIFLAAAGMTYPSGVVLDIINNRVVNFLLGSLVLLGTYLSGTYFAVPPALWCLYKADLSRYFQI